jgi:hypothetical protein
MGHCAARLGELARRAAAQLPSVTRRVLAEQHPRAIVPHDRVVHSRPPKPRLESCEVLSDLDRHMRSRGGTVIGILAQMDLLAVVALEPPGYAGQLRRRDNPPVSEDLEEEGFLRLHPSNRHTEVDVMKAQHARIVPGGGQARSIDWVSIRGGPVRHGTVPGRDLAPCEPMSWFSLVSGSPPSPFDLRVGAPQLVCWCPLAGSADGGVR